MRIYLLLEAGVLRFEVSAPLLPNVKVSTSLAGQGWAGLGLGDWVVGDKTLAGYKRVESSAPASASLFCFK